MLQAICRDNDDVNDNASTNNGIDNVDNGVNDSVYSASGWSMDRGASFYVYYPRYRSQNSRIHP